ncbi:hypothetical protein POKO110462_16470 [Pontibacter korlensis]|uniref:Uncharacterized protein n=1 Tax=Pontibacter korlensis TaxID=400092 RepID=A0A0E3ZI16_9BACT|nr:hypothetical protein [Pontibacter korlensis]AKD04364.1 hypothetical protein PKOR_16315 [Pontibacter korlensis]
MIVLDEVLKYIKNKKSSFIYAQPVKHEKLNGGDLEIYYELDHDQYLRLFFQAKVIKKSGYFSGLNQKNSNGKQIDLLEKFESIAGCQTFYIFYNGIAGFKFNHKDCQGDYTEKQLGCTIVETSEVKSLNKVYGDKIKHEILYNKADLKGRPWREIPCCLMKKKDSKGLRIYSFAEINSDPSFRPLNFEKEKASTLSYQQLPPSTDVTKINSTLREKGYQPAARLVLTKTEPNRK